MEYANPAGWFLLLVFVWPVLHYIHKAKRGKRIYVRRIAGIDAIDEAIGRTVEMGRPMVFTTGLIRGVTPLLYACLGVLRYIARQAAVFRSALFVPCADPEGMVLLDMAVQNAYRTERAFSRYNPANVRFLSDQQFAYASGYMGLVHREQIGAAFLFGEFAAESLILAEAGQQVGALQVAATTSYSQIPFFITSCDYTVIGEELYAAGAYLSEDPVQTGSLLGQDIAKLAVMVLVIIGVAQATVSEALTGKDVAAVTETGTDKKELPLARAITASWKEVLTGEDEGVEGQGEL